MADKAVIVLGAGGHAKILLDILLEEGANVIGILDRSAGSVAEAGGSLSVSIIGTDDDIVHYAPSTVELVNGLGSINVVGARFKIWQKFKALGYNFRRVIHPTAIVSTRARLGEGVQVMAGAVINVGSVIGDNAIINTHASIDHDCQIGSHVHIAPGCVMSGGVSIGSRTHIGTGSSIIQGITIGSDVLIGAGSVVVRDVPDGVKAFGVPARIR